MLRSFMIATFILGVFTAAFSVEEYEKYENRSKGYSIEYPNSWTIQENVDGLDVFFSSPKLKDRTIVDASVISGEIPSDITTEMYYTANLKNLLDKVPSMVLKYNCKVDLGGIPAFWIRYTRDDSKVEIAQYLFTSKGIGYVITCGAAQSDFERYKGTLDKIANSFRLIERAKKEEPPKVRVNRKKSY